MNALRLSVALGVACLVLRGQPAGAARADGGYEADVLPAEAGWVEQGDSFLGDHVSVHDGVMTYDGGESAGLSANGMCLPEVPLTEEAGGGRPTAGTLSPEEMDFLTSSQPRKQAGTPVKE